jgi:hypothetical protein
MKRRQVSLKNLIMAQMLLHNTDPGAGGGGSGGQDPAAAFQRLLDQHKNDGVGVASKLFDENYQLRTKLREAKEKLPKEGEVVLSVDDAKEWDAFRALNVKAADAKKAIESVPKLEKQNKELAAMEGFRELADIGLDGSKLKLPVLKDQLTTKFPDAVLSFRTEKDKDGKEQRVAYIKKSDKDSETSFADFASKELADYLPALKVTSGTPSSVDPGNTADPAPQGNSASVFDRIRDAVKKDGEGNKPADLNARFGRPATV